MVSLTLSDEEQLDEPDVCRSYPPLSTTDEGSSLLVAAFISFEKLVTRVNVSLLAGGTACRCWSPE